LHLHLLLEWEVNLASFNRTKYERVVVIARMMHRAVGAQLIINHDFRNLDAAAKELMRMCEGVIGQQSGPRWWDGKRKPK